MDKLSRAKSVLAWGSPHAAWRRIWRLKGGRGWMRDGRRKSAVPGTADTAHPSRSLPPLEKLLIGAPPDTDAGGLHIRAGSCSSLPALCVPGLSQTSDRSLLVSPLDDPSSLLRPRNALRLRRSPLLSPVAPRPLLQRLSPAGVYSPSRRTHRLSNPNLSPPSQRIHSFTLGA